MSWACTKCTLLHDGDHMSNFVACMACGWSRSAIGVQRLWPPPEPAAARDVIDLTAGTHARGPDASGEVAHARDQPNTLPCTARGQIARRVAGAQAARQAVARACGDGYRVHDQQQ